MKTINLCIALVILASTVFTNLEMRKISARIESCEADILEIREALAEPRQSGYVLASIPHLTPPKIISPVEKRFLTVTAYSPRACETDSDPLQTAWNKPVREGIVAVSRDLFQKGWSFGKKVYVEDHGVFTIGDLMGSSKKQSMDIFMVDTGKAIVFGKKKLAVLLIEA